MGAFSIWHWLIVLVVVLLLFGGSGKISSLMGDLAKGIKSFKKGLSDDDETTAADNSKAQEKKALENKARDVASERSNEKTGTQG
jgi:sec-independent protein translocase protein TatA